MIERLSFNIAVDITGILGLFFLLFTFGGKSVTPDRKNRQMRLMFWNMVLILLTDMIACIYRGRPEAILVLEVANTSNFVLSQMLILTFVFYVRLSLDMRQNEWRIGMPLLVISSVAMIVFLLLNPVHKLIFEIPAETGLYERRMMHPLVMLYGVFSLLFAAVQVAMKKDVVWKRRVPLMICCLLPLLATVVQIFLYGISLTNLAVLMTALILFSEAYRETEREIAAKELELDNTRAALVLSQIQPHFLFNSMATVMNLCDSDPQEAKDALQELSDYLHFKMSAMTGSHLVSFAEDLDFLRNYLKLEKRRYGDRLNVEFDIACTDFQIPLLTLQPLVENSIRHGISKKPGGGTVRITTRETPDCYKIILEDDGVGFAIQGDYENVIERVGLSSARRRLTALCDGGLTLTSSPGNGTRVEMTIGKEPKKREYPDS